MKEEHGRRQRGTAVVRLVLIKAVVTLFVVSVVVLLCKRFLRCIPCNRLKRRSVNTRWCICLTPCSPRKAADPGSRDIERCIG